MPRHTADITCGQCGERITIALGHASAIACPGCGTVIELGEGNRVTSPRYLAELTEQLDGRRR